MVELLDYELAEVHPSSTRRGCFFHYKKSLFKHRRQADLMEEYLVPDSPVRESLSIIGALGPCAPNKKGAP